jgi:hypothetical protein
MTDIRDKARKLFGHIDISLDTAIRDKCYDQIIPTAAKFRAEIIDIVSRNQNEIDPVWACEWARHVGDIPMMKDIVLSSKDSYAAYWWAVNIGDRDEMKQIVISDGNPEWAFSWADSIGNIYEMMDVVVRSKSVKWLGICASTISNTWAMRHIALKSGIPFWKEYFIINRV